MWFFSFRLLPRMSSHLYIFLLAHWLPKDVFWMNTLILNKKKFSFQFAPRRKCGDIEPRERDSKSIMEPRDLSSSARLFPNAQIKIRWVDTEIISRLETTRIITFPPHYNNTAHLPLLHQRQILHHPLQRRDHHREIKDYHQPRAVFIRNQLQGFRALLLPVDTQHQFTLT